MLWNNFGSSFLGKVHLSWEISQENIQPGISAKIWPLQPFLRRHLKRSQWEYAHLLRSKKTKHQVVHLKKTFPQHKYIGLIPRTFPEMRCVGSFPKNPLVTSSDTFTLLNPLKYYQSATLRIISAETEQQYKGFPGSWTTSGVKVPFHLKTNGPKWSLGPRHPKYLLRRCFGYAFRVQIPNLRRSLDV